MITLLERAFAEVQKLPNYLQEELAQQMIEDIENELKWQESFSGSDIDLGTFATMAQEALIEEQQGKTENKGFGED